MVLTLAFDHKSPRDVFDFSAGSLWPGLEVLLMADSLPKKRRRYSAQEKLQVVELCVEKCGGNKEKAAGHLDISHLSVKRQRISDWMKKGDDDPVLYWRKQVSKGEKRVGQQRSDKGTEIDFVFRVIS